MASLAELVAARQDRPLEPVRGEDPALITFTTGSSGRPKGAERSHRFLCAQHLALDREIPYRPDDIDLPVFPVFALNNLAGGVATVLPAIDLAATLRNNAPRAPEVQAAIHLYKQCLGLKHFVFKHFLFTLSHLAVQRI